MIRILRSLLPAVLVVCAFGLFLRALLGPLPFGLPVNSPMNAESFFGLAFVLLLLTRRETALKSRAAAVSSAVCIGALALLALLAFWRALPSYFLLDDFVLLKYANHFDFDALRPLLTTAGADGFFRPAGYLSLAADALWAGISPVRWHAIVLAIHIANAILVYFLASRLGASRWAALFAAALFSIHGSRPEAAVWLAARFDLLSTFFVLAGLLFFLWEKPVSIPAALACMVVAMLSKEVGYVFPLLIVLLGGRRKLRAAVPFFLLAGVVFAYRWSLLNGIGGYKDAAGHPTILIFGFVHVLKALFLRLWAVFFFPINWTGQPGVLLALAIVVYAASLVWVALRRDRFPRLGLALGFVAIASLPALHLLLLGPDLQKARLLYLPSVGFCLLLAFAIDGLWNRRLQWCAAAGILAFQFIALQHNLTIWNRVAVEAKRACVAGAASVTPATKKLLVWGVPDSLEGVYFLGTGYPECVEMEGASNLESVELRTGEKPAPEPGTSVLVWRPE